MASNILPSIANTLCILLLWGSVGSKLKLFYYGKEPAKLKRF